MLDACIYNNKDTIDSLRRHYTFCTKQNGHGQDRLYLQSPVKGAPCCHWINKPPLPLVSPYPTITHKLRPPQRRATG